MVELVFIKWKFLEGTFSESFHWTLTAEKDSGKLCLLETCLHIIILKALHKGNCFTFHPMFFSLVFFRDFSVCICCLALHSNEWFCWLVWGWCYWMNYQWLKRFLVWLFTSRLRQERRDKNTYTHFLTC